MLKAYAVALALSTSAPVAEKQDDTVQQREKNELAQTTTVQVKDFKGRKKGKLGDIF